MRPVPELCSVSRSRFVRIRFELLLRGFPTPYCYASLESNRSSYTSRSRRNELKQDLTAKKRWINYALDHLRSSPITAGIALSYLPRRLRRSNQDLSFYDLPRSFSLVFATPLEYPSFLSTYVVSLEFPRLRRSAGSSLDLPRVLPGISRVYDLPRLSRWSYIIIELFCVTRLNLSGLN